LHWTVKSRSNRFFADDYIYLTAIRRDCILIRFLNTGLASFQHLASLSALLGIFGMMMLWYPIPWVFNIKPQKTDSIFSRTVRPIQSAGVALWFQCYVAALFFQIVYIGSGLTLATGEILGPDHENLPKIFSLAV
jgi:hypothetical protein